MVVIFTKHYDTLMLGIVTHRSLFDQSIQGIALTDAPAYSFQGHPKASPGPHDIRDIFIPFIKSMKAVP